MFARRVFWIDDRFPCSRRHSKAEAPIAQIRVTAAKVAIADFIELVFCPADWLVSPL